MYVRYHTQLEVEKALALNGTRVNGDYIGVTRCTPEEVGEIGHSNLNALHSAPVDTRFGLAWRLRNRDYTIHENEIYKRAPVKRLSLCNMVTEWLFGI